MRYHIFVVICNVLALVMPYDITCSQMLYNPNDERFKALYLEKVQSDYRLQKDEYNRQVLLHDKQLISEREFNESAAKFTNAKITYQQAILSLVLEQPHITISKAVKYQSQNGQKRVYLILLNSSNGLSQKSNIKLEDFGEIQTDQVPNVYVSLVNDQHTIIGRPYEQKISDVKVNEPVKVDFFLLQDVDNVTVRFVYGDKTEEKTIYLEKDEQADKVVISSAQFSQEADLGTRAAYDLVLERFSRTENVYKLEVVNLPSQITWEFLETPTNARLTQVKFAQDANTRKLTLAIYLPESVDSTHLQLDQPLIFYAIAAPPGVLEKSVPREQKLQVAEMERLKVNFVRLELVPRGTGKILVKATNFYQELKPNQSAEFKLSVMNSGSRRLDNIRVNVDAPLSWTAVTAPDIIPILLPGKEEQLTVTITPPQDVNVGDYESTIKTESYINNRRVETEDKKIRIHIASSVSILSTGFLIIIILGVIGGLIFFGIRLSNK